MKQEVGVSFRQAEGANKVYEVFQLWKNNCYPSDIHAGDYVFECWKDDTLLLLVERIAFDTLMHE